MILIQCYMHFQIDRLEKAVSDLASLKRDIEALAKKYNDSEDTVKKLSYDNNELKLR